MILHGLASIKRRFSPASAPLFADSAPQMLNELALQGVELPGEQEADQELWQHLMDKGMERPSNGKVNICRFQGAVHVCEANCNMWWMDRFVRTPFLCCVLCCVGVVSGSRC